MAKELLKVDHVSISYGDTPIVRDVSFTVNEGEWLMIAGPNGAGKSTIINGISKSVPYSGEIRYREKNIREIKNMEIARHIGILSQNHTVGYDYTVREIVGLGRYAYRKGMFKTSAHEDQEKIEEALSVTGMKRYENQSILRLSGGEVQRCFLAQLLAQDPDIMILDEPANHLDLVYQKQMFELIVEWIKTPGRAVISVVHDLSLAKTFGTHGLLLQAGQVMGSGHIDDVLSSERLKAVYGMDVYGWMGQLLDKWK